MATNNRRGGTPILGLNVQGDIGPLTCYTSKRKKLVVFPRSPPLNPPSEAQEILREYFRNAARQWRHAAPSTKAGWNTAARRANLYVTGYNLWTWFVRTRDEQRLKTIERQARVTLVRPS